jgi:hypothetical protein
MKRHALFFDLDPHRLFSDEADFQAQLVQAAKRMGWDPIYHTHDSRHSPAGFLDLEMCHLRQKRHLHAECKNDDRPFTPEQLHWYATLLVCGQEAYLWRFKNWNDALAILVRRPGGPPMLGPSE